MKYRLLLGTASTLLVLGCASQPTEIPSQTVSPVIYQHLECDQIIMEMDRVGRRTGELYARLKKDADNDAVQMGVGLVLFWPVLFALEGGDGPEAAEYARLRGEDEALQQAATTKRCDMRLAKSIDEYIPKDPDAAEAKDTDVAKAYGLAPGKCDAVEVQPSVWKTVCNHAAETTAKATPVEPVPATQPSAEMAGGNPDSIESRLRQVEALYQRGVISEAEYRAAREKLMGQLVGEPLARNQAKSVPSVTTEASTAKPSE